MSNEKWLILILLLIAPGCMSQNSSGTDFLKVGESSILSDDGEEHTLSVYVRADAQDTFEALAALPDVTVQGDSLDRIVSFALLDKGTSEIVLHVDSKHITGNQGDDDWVWVTFYDRSDNDRVSVLNPAHEEFALVKERLQQLINQSYSGTP